MNVFSTTEPYPLKRVKRVKFMWGVFYHNKKIATFAVYSFPCFGMIGMHQLKKKKKERTVVICTLSP